MKNLWKILIPRRNGLEKKWWHRLIQVLIFGSTIIVIIISVLALITAIFNKEFSTSKYTAYSFEPGYESAKGTPERCFFDSRMMIKSFSKEMITYNSLDCGEYNNYFENGLSEFIESYYYSDKNELNEMRLKEGLSDEQIFSRLYRSQHLNNVYAKKHYPLQYGYLILAILILILIDIGWFIFWESIIYRTILYVIYGKKNN